MRDEWLQARIRMGMRRQALRALSPGRFLGLQEGCRETALAATRYASTSMALPYSSPSNLMILKLEAEWRDWLCTIAARRSRSDWDAPPTTPTQGWVIGARILPPRAGRP